MSERVIFIPGVSLRIHAQGGNSYGVFIRLPCDFVRSQDVDGIVYQLQTILYAFDERHQFGIPSVEFLQERVPAQCFCHQPQGILYLP